jgi:hypothetical protein
MPQTLMNKEREAYLVFGKLNGNTKSHKIKDGGSPNSRLSLLHQHLSTAVPPQAGKSNAGGPSLPTACLSVGRAAGS